MPNIIDYQALNFCTEPPVIPSDPLKITASSCDYSECFANSYFDQVTGKTVVIGGGGGVVIPDTLTATLPTGNVIGIHTPVNSGTPVTIRETITAIGNVTLSPLNILTIPYTDEAGVVSNRTVNLSSLAGGVAGTYTVELFNVTLGGTVITTSNLPTQVMIVTRNGDQQFAGVDYNQVGSTFTFIVPFGNSTNAQFSETVAVSYYY
jgi:hypothetical protein